MISRLQEAETRLSNTRSELEAAHAGPENFRAELRSEAAASAEMIRVEFRDALRAEIKSSSEILRSELRFEAKASFDALQSALHSAKATSKSLRNELRSAAEGSEALRSELEEANRSIRSEIQARTDQIIEKVTDEHHQEVADLESKLEALRRQLDAPAIIKPRSVKDVALSPDS